MSNFIIMFLAFAVSLATALIIIPQWIKACSKWKMFDVPDSRKHHLAVVPSMGGIGIFAGISVSLLLFANCFSIPSMPYILCASIILFFTGFFDDMMDIKALKKLFVQLLAASIVVAGGVRLTGFYGLFGVHEISPALQWVLSIFAIVFFTNAFNFIDGIDGLAGSIGLIISSSFGIILLKLGETDLAVLSFAISGALAGFLFYNFDPAKVFMGDTGSLVVGFLLSVLAVAVLNIVPAEASGIASVSPALVFAVLFVPVFDICRVFFIRLFTGSSPFNADRSHIHHMILRQQFGHRGATLMVAVFNLMVIFTQVLADQNDINRFIVISSAMGIFLVNSKIISFIAILRNKILGEPKKKLQVEKTVL